MTPVFIPAAIPPAPVTPPAAAPMMMSFFSFDVLPPLYTKMLIITYFTNLRWHSC